MRNRVLKIFAAAIISPLILALIIIVFSVITAFFEGKPTPDISSSQNLYILGLVYIFGLGGTIFIGLPIYFILKRYDYISYKNLLYSGFIAGWLMLSIHSFNDNDLPNLESIITFGLFGAIVSSSFWLFIVYIPHRVFKKDE